MDDVAHIRLVDTHTEGDGGHDDINLIHDEIVLRLCARRRIHASMIGTGIDVIGPQHLGQFLHFLT